MASRPREGGGLAADLGCGAGRIGAHLAGHGLDLRPAVIEIAACRYASSGVA